MSKFLRAEVKSCCSERASPSIVGQKAPKFRTKAREFYFQPQSQTANRFIVARTTCAARAKPQRAQSSSARGPRICIPASAPA